MDTIPHIGGFTCKIQRLDKATGLRDLSRAMASNHAQDQNLAVCPGQEIEYMVVVGKSSRNHAALTHETVVTCDPSYYEMQLIHATESVLSPGG